MNISSRTPDGQPNRCAICGKPVIIEPSIPPGDAPCPHCGSLLWFVSDPVQRKLAKLDFVVQGAVIPDLQAVTKEEALRTMVGRLTAADAVRKQDEELVVAALLRREELGSTGIGGGFAVPHLKHPAVERLIGAVAWSQKGIPFDSLDRQPVHQIILALAPPDRPGDLLRAVEQISHAMRESR